MFYIIMAIICPFQEFIKKPRDMIYIYIIYNYILMGFSHILVTYFLTKNVLATVLQF